MPNPLSSLIGRFVRLKSNPQDLYFCKTIDTEVHAFSLNTGQALKNTDLIRAGNIQGIYSSKNNEHFESLSVPSIIVDGKVLTAGDICKGWQSSDTRWFLLGVSGGYYRKLYFDSMASTLLESELSSRFLVLSSTKITFRASVDKAESVKYGLPTGF